MFLSGLSLESGREGSEAVWAERHCSGDLVGAGIMHWRQMEARDVAGVAALANKIHKAHPEDPAVYLDRLTLFPEGCRLLEDEAGPDPDPKACLISHPWLRRTPPALNSTLGGLPENPDCYYLHDLAVDESVRGRGYALSAVKIVLGQARLCGLADILLIAIGDAHPFWEHVGFRRYEGYGNLAAKGYGPEAAGYCLTLEL
jgi:GNAT superfamily N-acetyltransferase